MRKVILVAAMGAAVSTSAISTSALAKDDAPHFQRCDGFQQPTKKGDGLNSGTYLFGLAKSREDIRRNSGNVPPAKGVEACEAALADPLLKSEFRARRASLQQALAFHQLSLFRFEDAIATIDEIETTKQGLDPVLFDRGIGVGNRLLRAFGLIKAERHGEAMAELDAIDATRPYAVSILRKTDKLRLMMDDRLDHQIERIERRAPIDPLANLDGFLLALEYSRFDDAVRFGQGLEFELPKSKGGWTIDGEASLNYQLIEFRAAMAGGLAYALAASGDELGSAAQIADAKHQLELAMQPPPPRKDGRKQRKSVTRDYEARKQFGQRGVTAVTAWEQAIELRRDAPGLDLDQLTERLDAFEKPPGPIIVDLISRAEGTDAAVREELAAGLLEISHNKRTDSLRLSVFQLLDMLPHPEAPDNQVRYKKGGDGYFLSGNGFSRKKMDAEDDWTIRFTDDVATAATVEEFSILAAAQEAEKRGYDRLLLQTFRTVERTTRHYGAYGGYYGSSNSGREAQMRIRFIRSDAIPSDLQGSQWRMLNVSDVRSGLANLPQRPSRSRR